MMMHGSEAAISFLFVINTSLYMITGFFNLPSFKHADPAHTHSHNTNKQLNPSIKLNKKAGNGSRSQ